MPSGAKPAAEWEEPQRMIVPERSLLKRCMEGPPPAEVEEAAAVAAAVAEVEVEAAELEEAEVAAAGTSAGGRGGEPEISGRATALA